MNDTNETKIIQDYHPLEYLSDENSQSLGLIILNQNVGNLNHLKTLWSKATIKGVADGGINHLHEVSQSLQEAYIPDYISGDFDSATEEILDFYKGKGVEIIRTPDQNKTDFTKCLEILLKKVTESLEIQCIVVLAGLNGRFDHQMANINTIIKAHSQTNTPIYLHDNSSQSLVVALRTGRSRLFLETSYLGVWCGLIPVNSTVVSTTGLKWNFAKSKTEFGSMVSTSNEIEKDCVTVDSDRTIIWTMGIKS